MMLKNCLTDIEGILIGQVTDEENLTGCTVVLIPDGAACGIDVCGGAPGSRESSMLESEKSNEKVYAIFLTGGSAYGLSVGDGIMTYLEEHGIGFDTGYAKVGIVPGAVIFDLNIGNPKVRPTSEMGYLACTSASCESMQQGNYGAGMGATVGKVLGNDCIMKGGIGGASFINGDGVIVSAIVVVNAFGDIRDYSTGEILAGALKDGVPQDTIEIMTSGGKNIYDYKLDNTTIAIIGTDAKLSKTQCNILAKKATHGLVRSIFPVSTTLDGDTVFAFSRGDKECEINTLGVIACEVLAIAVNNAIKSADEVGGIKSYKSIHKG